MNKRIIRVLLLGGLFGSLPAAAKMGTTMASSSHANSQSEKAIPADGAPQASSHNPASDVAQTDTQTRRSQFQLEDGTPVKLRLQQTLSSAAAQENDKVDFEVLEEIVVNGVVVIPKGGVAWGTVTEAQPKRRMARGGKLNVNIDAVRLGDGERAALRAVKGAKGGGHTGAMTGAMVATGIVFFPAAPLFLFMHGKDITIPKGTEITAFVNGDMKLEPAKFASPAPAAAAVSTTAPTSVASQAARAQTSSAAPTSTLSTTSASTSADPPATVTLKSTPDGADVTVDGKFAGDTPSTLKLPPGDHTISVRSSGFKNWQRTMTLSAGSDVTLNATLEKTQ